MQNVPRPPLECQPTRREREEQAAFVEACTKIGITDERTMALFAKVCNGAELEPEVILALVEDDPERARLLNVRRLVESTLEEQGFKPGAGFDNGDAIISVNIDDRDYFIKISPM